MTGDAGARVIAFSHDRIAGDPLVIARRLTDLDC
jgi:hypothetical protein